MKIVITLCLDAMCVGQRCHMKTHKIEQPDQRAAGCRMSCEACSSFLRPLSKSFSKVGFVPLQILPQHFQGNRANINFVRAKSSHLSYMQEGTSVLPTDPTTSYRDNLCGYRPEETCRGRKLQKRDPAPLGVHSGPREQRWGRGCQCYSFNGGYGNLRSGVHD